MDIIDLPNEIIEHILYNELPLNDLNSCLGASKLFHTFNKNQMEILLKASHGWDDCICKGQLGAVKWLYNRSIKLNNPIDIHADVRFIPQFMPLKPTVKYRYDYSPFLASSINGYLELVKWLYETASALNNPIPLTTYGYEAKISI